METSEPTVSLVTETDGLAISFYVAPRIEGQPETARSRAVIDARPGVELPAAELDRVALEWLHARGKFQLDAFTAALHDDEDQDHAAEGIARGLRR